MAKKWLLEERLSQSPLYGQAVIHSSYANERGGLISNERLEFLGDAVLQLVTSDYLYQKFPTRPEGDLTKIRAALVCEANLARRAQDMQLGRFLKLGKGEEISGGRERASLLADAYEALLGAIYLEDGLEKARELVYERLNVEINQPESWVRDPKSELQELVQKRDLSVSYVLVSEEGPDHRKRFQVQVMVGEQCMGEGSGFSKKEAEQAAALQALRKKFGFKHLESFLKPGR